MENIIHVPIGGYDTGRLPNVQQYDQNSRVFVCKLWKAPTEMYVQSKPYVIAEGGFVGVVFRWRGAEPSDEYETELVDSSTIKFIVPGAATQRKGEIEMQLVIHENGGVLHGPKMMFNVSESLKRGDRVTEPMLILEALNKMTREAAEEAQNAAERVEQMQIDASGLAGDSNKLGGKPSEHYLPAVNLLDNSDFRASHFIAQDGFNVPHGSELYIGDRWMRAANIVPTSLENGICLSLTDQHSFIQQRVKLTPGTTYTVALKTEKGTTYRRIAVFNTALNEIFASVEGGDGVLVATFTAAYETMAILLYPAYAEGGGSSVFQWAALYEGCYTAETLPPYVPRPYTVELAECQRYHLPVVLTPMGFGYVFNNLAVINVPLPQPMRAIPTMPEGLTFYIIQTNGNTLTSTTYYIAAMNGNAVQINAVVNGAVESAPIVALTNDFAFNIDL